MEAPAIEAAWAPKLVRLEAVGLLPTCRMRARRRRAYAGPIERRSMGTQSLGQTRSESGLNQVPRPETAPLSIRPLTPLAAEALP